MTLKVWRKGSNFLIPFMALVMLVGVPAANALFLGPTPYLETADSPFDFDSDGVVLEPDEGFSYGHLEDFEDNSLNTPGVTASAGNPYGPGGVTDSVDADDGTIDGSGTLGHSFFYNPGATGIRFTFNAGVLGALPTHAGIVWTDGSGTITFEAFDASGISLGTISGTHAMGPPSSPSGDTAEDRFYGVIDMGGISAIKIKNGSGGIEVDHLQYGHQSGPPIPEPSTLLLFGIGVLGFIGYSWQRWKQNRDKK